MFSNSNKNTISEAKRLNLYVIFMITEVTLYSIFFTKDYCFIILIDFCPCSLFTARIYIPLSSVMLV
jgi:hypothetical protein